MEAAEAAGHMGRMIRLVEQGYTDGIAYVEEVYKILRGKGYAPGEILTLCQEFFGRPNS